MSETNEIGFHPLAAIFPLMEGAEFDELVADIKANGQRQWIVTYEGMILDGRNRYRACLAAGVKPGVQKGDDCVGDPAAYVVSANIHRRHLNAEQKRDLIAKLLKAQPQKSDRQIAETVKASPTTVGVVRREIESTVQSGQLPPKRIGADGKARKQPTEKPKAQQQHDHAGTEAQRHEIETAIKRLIRKWNVALSALDRPEPGDHDVADPRTVKENLLEDVDGHNEFLRKVAPCFRDTARTEDVVFWIERLKARAEGYRKVFKLSRFEDTARAEIRTAIEGLIQNLRECLRDLAEKSADDPEARSANDIGPASSGEAERLRIRVDELQAEKRQLEIKVAGLESEV